MTTIYKGTTVLEYREWLDKPEVQQELDASTEECDMCDGSGDHTCECGDEHPCGACDGSGSLNDFRHIYEKQLRDEIERLHKWIKSLEDAKS